MKREIVEKICPSNSLLRIQANDGIIVDVMLTSQDMENDLLLHVKHDASLFNVIKNFCIKEKKLYDEMSEDFKNIPTLSSPKEMTAEQSILTQQWLVQAGKYEMARNILNLLENWRYEQ